MSPATDTDESRVQTARQRVGNALLCMRLLADPRQKSVINTVAIAVQEIITAAYSATDLRAIAPEAAAEAAALMSQACDPVAEAMAGKMSPERVYFLMGAAAGLLTATDDPFREDHVHYAALLNAELKLVHHSRALADRGFPMVRAARIARAWAEPRDPASRPN